MTILKRKLTLCFLVIFLLLITSFFGLKFFSFPNPPERSRQQNPEAIKKEWRRYIGQVGLERAYKDFKSVYRESPPFFQHSYMHVIGSLIYEVAGLKGLVYCDDSFMFGCFHGFFGDAFSKGLEDLHTMDNYCIQSYGEKEGACQHGMGHGILVYLGLDKIKEALDVCSGLRWKYKIGGCDAGVYMEYNFSNVTHSVQKIRELDLDNPNYPCNELKIEDQYGCYFAQADWWESVYASDYKKIGELCEELNPDNKEACYLGTGNVALQSSRFEIERTINKCNAVESEYGKVLCKAAARWIYILNTPQHKLDYGLSEIFCNSVDARDKQFCMDKSELIK